MAVTNLLDRLAEDYQGTHPVEYRAPLAKIGRKIGDKVYSLGGGAKGVSARDIIRNGRYNDGVYPFDVLEKQSPNDLDEFKKAFENVRAQREAWNTKYFKDDALGYNGDPLATPKEKLQNKKTYLTYEADKQNHKKRSKHYALPPFTRPQTCFTMLSTEKIIMLTALMGMHSQV